jgi:hypothetical protein
VGLAHEGNHVVLAVAVELDVAYQHQLPVAVGILERPHQVLRGILMVAAEVLGHRRHDTARRVAQAVALQVLADVLEQAPHVVHGLLFGDRPGDLLLVAAVSRGPAGCDLCHHTVPLSGVQAIV